MTDSAESSPRWQLDSIFPGISSPEFEAAWQRLDEQLVQLESHLSTGLGTGRTTVESILKLFNDSRVLEHDLGAYLYLITSTDAFDDEAQARQSALDRNEVRLEIIEAKLTAWIGRLDLDSLLEQSEFLRAHGFWLRQQVVLSERLLAEAAEEVAAALNPTGGSAWAKLHDQLISRETIEIDVPGQGLQEHGMSGLYNLELSEDAAVRHAAWQASMQLLERNAVTFAAAINSIKGQVGELARRRGWADALAESLFDNHIDSGALEAMQQACAESFPLMRRYLRAKAKRLGKEQLDWSDLEAPVPGVSARSYTWDEAREFVVRQFRTYSDDLADFADSAFERGWLDGPPRKGKTNGAYCYDLATVPESRIMLNFAGTLNDLFTIAHELGHAFHNDRMYRFGRTYLQKQEPMTLAETASIFCETIIFNAVMNEASAAERLGILSQDLDGAAQLILDIHSRFLFEKGVFDRRSERELSVTELKQLMLDAQEQTYGDALEPGSRNPWMWAQKGHYYSPFSSFYNYPYTFGYLFGLGLYAQYLKQPEGFHERYDELLASSGMAEASALGQSFGIDIRSPDFWRLSLVVLQERVEEYEKLA